MPVPGWKFPRLLVSGLLALVLVLIAVFTYLLTGLPNTSGPANTTVESLEYQAAKFNFALGSGIPFEDRMIVDGFTNGYALLTTGAVSIQASSFRVLDFVWQTNDPTREAAFFWRRSDDPENVVRTDITTPGFNLLDLSTERDWRGEIIEFGFLFAGDIGDVVELGEVSLEPDSMDQRLHLMWRAWTGFEEWSQGSINFLHGGGPHQLIPLPLLVIAWLILAVALLWLFSVVDKNTDSRTMVLAGSLLFLVAWILLDIRWTTNNLEQTQRSLRAHWQTDDQQRLGMGLDGEIYQYVQKLKADILNRKTARILIIGDENITVYYMFRAKYHLLPHSVYVARQFSRQLAPESLDFVLFLGPPGKITSVPGWELGWQQVLAKVESWDWGVVYRVNGVH